MVRLVRMVIKNNIKKAKNRENMIICTNVFSNHQYETKKGIKAHHKGIENQKNWNIYSKSSI